MATSSRQSALFGVQDWKRFYQTYRDADFQSFDYETLRKSFIDYITQNYPETFNDYIESSEFVALMDVIAFMGQALAFRGDLNARENFIDTAERRDSVIKLVNLIGYTPKRNIAAQGLMKVTAISTTENVIDINGTNLSNTVVLWNDPANSIWQEQFNAILNMALVTSQRIGKPAHTQNLLGIRTDEYAINIPDDQTPIVPFTASIDGQAMDFELVNVSSLGKETLYELLPTPARQFSLLYRNDKMGYGSIDTGFFFYFKQGSLQEVDFQFNEQIENNFYLIDIQNINNDDTWLIELDSNNVATSWDKVENIFAVSKTQDENDKKIFSVLSRTNDQVTYLFGDGVFSEIPLGRYKAYVRSSNGLTYSITPDELSGVVVNIEYISRTNKVETLTLTLSLQQTVTNALQRENLNQIKQRAPARYYTQNRMVNGEDYTNFPFTKYNSIIKSKAINRTSIGVSRNQDISDPTGKYSDIKIFSNDGVLYLDETPTITSFDAENKNNVIEFFSSIFPKILSSYELLQYFYEYYPRFTGKYLGENSIDGKCYWKKVNLLSGMTTGYFYVKNSSNLEIPISVGRLSSTNTKFIDNGSNIKFVAPIGKYFDKANRLVSGTPNFENEGRLYIWVKIETVIDDGYNNGLGKLSNGNGPVILNQYVPSEAYLDLTVTNPNSLIEPEKYYGNAVIPTFSNTLSPNIIDELMNLIELKTNYFKLVYDHTILNDSLRYSISRDSTTTFNSIAEFTYDINTDKFIVTVKARTYIFGSESNVKFLFNPTDIIYDSNAKQNISDNIKVLRINNNPNFSTDNVTYLQQDINLTIYDQPRYNDGILNDHAILLTNINGLTKSVTDPDFFKKIAGNISKNIFFTTENTTSINYQTNILPNDYIITAYNTKEDIELIKYEYPNNTVFYARTTNTFHLSTVRPLTNPPILDLNDVTSEYYYMVGQNNIKFEYKKISTNSFRIDPSMTNIIDIYVVTESYYNQYRSWITDNTNTITEPSKPSINELKQIYSDLDNYKMLSDTVILNSVAFKPIFGSKAEPTLQGIIKVIKNPASVASESQIRTSVLSVLNNYFTLDKWDFGDTFYFSELSAYLHMELAGLISSVVVVPNDPTKSFGDLYEIKSAPNEIFINGATINDIIVISSLTSKNLQQR